MEKLHAVGEERKKEIADNKNPEQPPGRDPLVLYNFETLMDSCKTISVTFLFHFHNLKFLVMSK